MPDKKDRVVFFSKDESTRYHKLAIAEELLNNPPNFAIASLDILLEFYHIKLYFDNDLFLPSWTDEVKTNFMSKTVTAYDHTRQFFLGIKAEDLQKEIKKLYFKYNESFWYLFMLFEVYKKVDSLTFSNILAAFPTHIHHILKSKQLTQHYDHPIRQFLLSYGESAKLLLAEEKHGIESDKYHFPKSLTAPDKESIITAYLDSEDPHLNYVELIINARSLRLPPKIMLKAAQVYKKQRDRIFTGKNTSSISVSCTLDLQQTESVKYESLGMDTKVSYGGRYLDTLTDDVQLFNTFSRLFFYTNEDEQIELLSRASEQHILEKILMRPANAYWTGTAFYRKDMLSTVQLALMSDYLVTKSRTIESLIDSFVQQFFRNRFGLNNLAFKMPDANTVPSDKIRLLAPELEYLLKQYKNFVQDGAIDHDLLWGGEYQ